MLQDKELEEQLRALVEGRLARAEAERLEQLVTSDPTVARAYADAKLRLVEDENLEESTTSVSAVEQPDTTSPACCESASEGSQDAGPGGGLLHKLCRLFGAGGR